MGTSHAARYGVSHASHRGTGSHAPHDAANSREVRGTRADRGREVRSRDGRGHEARQPRKMLRPKDTGLELRREEYGQTSLGARSQTSRRRQESRLRKIRDLGSTRPPFPFKPLIAIVAVLLVASVGVLAGTSIMRALRQPAQTQEAGGKVVMKGGRSTAIDDSAKIFTTTYDWDNATTKRGRISYKMGGTVVSRTGIDVSEHNGKIDWSKVAADGIDFTYIRIGYRGSVEGNITHDKRFEQNFDGARKNGLDVGVYFYSQAITAEEAREEARYVVKQLDGYATEYPVVFDMEPSTSGDDRVSSLTNDQMTAIAKAFCKELQKNGYYACVYGSRADLAHYDLAALSRYGFWYAEYAKAPTMALRYGIWQYTDSGKVDGIDGNVDLDIDLTGALEKVQRAEKSKAQ